MTVEISELAHAKALAVYTEADGKVDQHPVQHAELLADALEAAAPVILEDRVEAVAIALYEAERRTHLQHAGPRGLVPVVWDEQTWGSREAFRGRARETLGLPAPERKEGE